MTVVYSRTGLGFTRLPSSGFAWDITDLTNIDPSGNGTTQIGDYARYTNPTTSAIEVYRLRAVPLGATAGTGSITTWVPASIYGEANLTIRGYLIGTETMPASGSSIRGYLVSTANSGSVTSSSGKILMQSNLISSFALLESNYTLLDTDKIYLRLNIRVSQTNGVNSGFYNVLSAFVTSQNKTGNSGKYIPSTIANPPVLVGSTLMIKDTGSPISAINPELIEILAEVTNNLVSVKRDNQPYFSIRRNAQASTGINKHNLFLTNPVGAGAQSVEFSQLYLMTY